MLIYTHTTPTIAAAAASNPGLSRQSRDQERAPIAPHRSLCMMSSATYGVECSTAILSPSAGDGIQVAAISQISCTLCAPCAVYRTCDLNIRSVRRNCTCRIARYLFTLSQVQTTAVETERERVCQPSCPLNSRRRASRSSPGKGCWRFDLCHGELCPV